MDSEPTYIPKDVLPYPVGRQVSGRIVARLGDRLYRIDLSGRHYTAEVSAELHPKPFSAGDPVMVRVVSKHGSKAYLEIIQPDFPHLESPSVEDLGKFARSVGWPEDDPAALAVVGALVKRRMPLRSAESERVYRMLKSKPNPTCEDAEQLLQ